jgi:hypothetical protein
MTKVRGPRRCPKCGAFGRTSCPQCGYKWPDDQRPPTNLRPLAESLSPETQALLRLLTARRVPPRFVVLSPDDLPIAPRTFTSRTAAERALTDWCDRFTVQGYYASVRERIPVDRLAERCRIEVTTIEEGN